MNQHRPSLNRVTNKLSQVVHQIQERNESNLILKVVHLWKKHPNEQDQNIMLQRVLYILQLESKQRSTAQLRILEKYFQSDFPYIQKLQEEISSDLCLKILKEFQVEKHPHMHSVFHQGEVGRKMYFVLEGEVGILIPSMEKQNDNSIQHNKSSKTFEDTIQQMFGSCKLIAVKKKFDHFGEIAIEQRVPRTATVITKSDCIFATLSYDSYQKVLGWLNEKRREEKLQFLSSIPPFKYWSENSQLIFISSCQQIQYQTNQIIYKRHMKGDFLYLIKEGEIIVQKWDKVENNTSDDENDIFVSKREERMNTLGVYSPGQIVGDYELYMEQTDQKQVVRITQAQTRLLTIVFAISITEFLNFIRINQPTGWFNNYLKQKYEKKWLNVQNGANLFKTEVDQKNKSSPKKIKTIPKLQFLDLEDGSASSKCYVYCRTKPKYKLPETQEVTHIKLSKEFLSPSQLEISTKKNKSLRKYLASSGIFQTKRTYESQSQSQFSLNQMIRKIKQKVENYKDKFEMTDASILQNQPSLKSMTTISHSPQLSQQIQLQRIQTLPNSLRHINIRNIQSSQYKFQLIK